VATVDDRFTRRRPPSVHRLPRTLPQRFETLLLSGVRADAFVFATLDGKPQPQRNALRAIVTAAGKAKLGHVTAHDLRHSLVANALDAGLTLTEASRLARHATRLSPQPCTRTCSRPSETRSARSSRRGNALWQRAAWAARDRLGAEWG